MGVVPFNVMPQTILHHSPDHLSVSPDHHLQSINLSRKYKRSAKHLLPCRPKLSSALGMKLRPAMATSAAKFLQPCRETSRKKASQLLEVERPDTLAESRATVVADQTACDDLDLDYREAAAALEHLFIESPSLDDNDHVVCSSSSAAAADTRSLSSSTVRAKGRSLKSTVPGRRRKDLLTRISLRRKRLMAQEPRDQGGTGNAQAQETMSNSIISPAVSKLLLGYGDGALNLMAQNWSKLERQLLTVEEERWLGSFMKQGKALEKLRERLEEQVGREPTEEEWAQAAKMDVDTLSTHLALHQAARNKLLKLNLRLVKHQARKYAQETASSSLTAVDLCQEGVKGLLAAVDKFDPAKGCRFSTYAIFWIRNSILRAQTRSGYPIRAPFNFAEMKMSINKLKWEMRLEAGEEVDKFTGDSMKSLLERAGVDEERYKVVMRSGRRPVSLHTRDRVTGAELIDHLADPNSHQDVVSGYLVGAGGNIGATDPTLRLGIDDVLDSLNPKESLVLRQRFGLDGKGERALGEIGRSLRISREMVRKYEVRGLLKLRHPTRLAYLRSFLTQDS